MRRQSILEYFQTNSRPLNEIAVSWQDGYRMRHWTYDNLLSASWQFAEELKNRQIAKGDRVLIWGKNSGHWIAAFLGCIGQGAVAVPMDAIADPAFANRVAADAQIRLAVVGRDLPSLTAAPGQLPLNDIGVGAAGVSAQQWAPIASDRSDPVQIVFTSGTTAEPRGVVITHGNILANIEPIEREFQRYRHWERFVHPIRFLDLLPLSHVFGQLLGIFLPQVVGGTSVFVDTLNPAEIARTIRKERVSVLVTVPRLIESLQDSVEREISAAGKDKRLRRDLEASSGEHFIKRWWRFRYVRRRFGWKFWALISGGAALPAASETFWNRLGYALIQGYGLTETTSLVSLNHPFRLKSGSIGQVLPGLEVKLSPEGEILVRGENVATGYWTKSQVSPVLGDEGWFRTGDLGERDSAGHLFFKGRLKNVIVTPEGLNVYPSDLEAELRKEPEVRDCLVIPLPRDGNSEACAVLLLRNSAVPASEIVARANARLASLQQMRHWTVWPDEDFPRTPTQKPALGTIAAFVASQQLKSGTAASESHANSPLDAILARISHGATQGDNPSLQLTSIERVELMSAIEDRFQVDLGESEFSAISDKSALEHLIANPGAGKSSFHYPKWPQSIPARMFRALVWSFLGRPAMLLLGWPRVRGREKLSGTDGPVLVIANHITFLDPAYVLAGLPWRYRRRLAVAMDGELLESMRHPPVGMPLWLSWRERIAAFLVVAIFNVFPLPRRAGFRKSFAFAGDLIDRGWSVLVFPEGERSHTLQMNPFRSGIGLLATRLGVPVVPMRLNGLAELQARGKKWAPPLQIEVAIASPLSFQPSFPPEAIAKELQEKVESLRSS